MLPEGAAVGFVAGAELEAETLPPLLLADMVYVYLVVLGVTVMFIVSDALPPADNDCALVYGEPVPEMLQVVVPPPEGADTE
jgi:hypothetical protein